MTVGHPTYQSGSITFKEGGVDRRGRVPAAPPALRRRLMTPVQLVRSETGGDQGLLGPAVGHAGTDAEHLSQRRRYLQEYGVIAGGSSVDIDHMRDLQLEGHDTVENLDELDKSVNRSLGRQIRSQTRHVPPGTRIRSVTISDRGP